jgi:hypothetical protein
MALNGPVGLGALSLLVNTLGNSTTGKQMDTSGTTMDVSGTILDPALIVPDAPDILTLAELLADRDIVLAKEAADKDTLESVASQSIQGLKPKLLEWVMKGRPDGFPIVSLTIQPPAQCSDGVVRDLPAYIEFCSGASFVDHVGRLQEKLPDIRLSFANIAGNVCITVLKA